MSLVCAALRRSRRVFVSSTDLVSEIKCTVDILSMSISCNIAKITKSRLKMSLDDYKISELHVSSKFA